MQIKKVQYSATVRAYQKGTIHTTVHTNQKGIVHATVRADQIYKTCADQEGLIIWVYGRLVEQI